MAKIGDTVRFLNSVGGGKIVRIDGQMAYVDEDGFETPVLLRECVVVMPGTGITPPTVGMAAKKAKEAEQKLKEPKIEAHKADFEPWVETAEGERLNIVLAYEAGELKRLSQTNFDAYLVNDSNYTLSVAYLTRGNEQKGWTTRWAGTVEPGMQEYLGEVLREDLSKMDRIAVQYFAYKPDREFELKAMACVEHKLDTTKFFKLHCFQPNVYFDEPVIALNIVRNDLPARQIEIDPAELERQMRSKASADKPKENRKPLAPSRKEEPLVVDLHIAELVDTTAGLSNADMLNLQIDTFRRVMDANLKNHGKKIVFIHGKGEGVLRKALLKELAYRYKDHDVQDASFREYGFGATQVKIK